MPPPLYPQIPATSLYPLCVYSQDSLLMSGLYHAFSCVKSTQGLNTKLLRLTEASTFLHFCLSVSLIFMLNFIYFLVYLFYRFCMFCLYLISPLLFLYQIFACYFSQSPFSFWPPLYCFFKSHTVCFRFPVTLGSHPKSICPHDGKTGCCYTCVALFHSNLIERRGAHAVFMSCLVPHNMKQLLHLMFFGLKSEFKRAVNVTDSD